MNLEDLYREIRVFSEATHGSSDYHKDELFVIGDDRNDIAPLSYLIKKVGGLEGPHQLLKEGFQFDSLELAGSDEFRPWFEKQFSRKLKRKTAREVSLLHLPDNKSIFDAIEKVNECYQILKDQQILMNGKKLPVQLGEWYAKCVFGLEQRKSTSQRGFDFYKGDKRIEVKISWSDKSSPKGVKIRKTMVELADHCIIMYVAKNFMIREICFLDSEFILRKFAGKGHTIFLKDPDIGNYFFSSSDKHLNKIATPGALLRYSSPMFAMKLSERISK